MGESPRIEELKRRVQVDPASIAFAALAEEYRRAGRCEEAIATCQAGLQRHPAYLSAHVTLGRSMLELGRFDEARVELEHVLRAAPENLAAIRGLAEIHHRRGELPEALEHYRSALQVAKHDTELEQTVDQISRQVRSPVPAPAVAGAAVEHPAVAAVEPAALAQPKPAPLELVTWARRGPDPEPARTAAAEQEAPVETDMSVASEPELAPEPEVYPESELAPAPQLAPAPEFAPEVEWASEPAFAPEIEFTSEPEFSPEPEFASAPQFAPEPESRPGPDPALLALEGLLAAILREKDDLAARSGIRR